MVRDAAPCAGAPRSSAPRALSSVARNHPALFDDWNLRKFYRLGENRGDFTESSVSARELGLDCVEVKRPLAACAYRVFARMWILGDGVPAERPQIDSRVCMLSVHATVFTDGGWRLRARLGRALFPLATYHRVMCLALCPSAQRRLRSPPMGRRPSKSSCERSTFMALPVPSTFI